MKLAASAAHPALRLAAGGKRNAPALLTQAHVNVKARPYTLYLQDWLFIAAKRVSAVEYCLLLATFGLVMAFGLEAGIAAGIVLAALHFAYRWAGGWLGGWGETDGPGKGSRCPAFGMPGCARRSACLAVPQPAMPASARLHTL